MSSPDHIDDRFDELVSELRAGRPAASPELHARVRTIVSEAPVPAPRWQLPHFGWRRLGLVLAPAALAAGAGFALVHGFSSSSTPQKSAATERAVWHRTVVRGAFAGKPTDQRLSPAPSALQSAVAPPPSARLQDYRVTMRVRLPSLDALSKATVRAMRITRSLGGYVANVEYSSPNVRHGDAVLVLRIPIANVQHFSVVDLQKRYDAEVARIGKLRVEIAKLEAEIAGGSLTDVDRAHAQERLEYDRLQLARLTAEKRTTLNHARLATARLSLTTFHPKRKHVVPPPPSRFDRTMGDAASVLGKELVWLLYALLVAAPFAVIAAGALVLERARRRRTERRLIGATS
jgi:hypothetical protein